jgi:hypothetical protein
MTGNCLGKRLADRVPDNDLEQFFIQSCRWNFGAYSELEKYGFEHPLMINYEDDDAQMLMARVDHTAYVAFKGSRLFPVSTGDIDHVLVPYAAVDYGCRVHGVFHNVYLSMRKNLFGYLTVGGIHAAVFVGHSMGGAIAQIASVDVGVHTDIGITCRSFGSPMPGDRGFACRFLCNVSNYERYVLRGDPIRLIPEENGYVHPCQPTMIGKTSDEIALGIFRLHQKIMEFLSGWKRSIDVADIDERHGIHSYLSALGSRAT